jgi:hypothetical protein
MAPVAWRNWRACVVDRDRLIADFLLRNLLEDLHGVADRVVARNGGADRDGRLPVHAAPLGGVPHRSQRHNGRERHEFSGAV